MPPKAKFTREEIVSAALDVVRKNGYDALTARAVAAELASSARPIFTVFDGMDELTAETTAAARRIYERYESEGMDEENAFKGSGMGYVRFAMKEPKLFQMLFMREAEGGATDTRGMLKKIDNFFDRIIQSVVNGFGVDENTAFEIYLHLWVYTHGIASLIATGVCAFTEEEVGEMLAVAGKSIIVNYMMKSKEIDK